LTGRNSFAKRVFSFAVSTLLVWGMLTGGATPAASAEERTGGIFAAAHMGAMSVSGTTLPESIEAGGETQRVAWFIEEDTFLVPYETVTVTGMTEQGDHVTAQVLVIPPADHPLVYFVDSGRGGDSEGSEPSDSPFHEAVNQLTGGSLVNGLPDQRFVPGDTSWGFDDRTQKVRNSKVGGHTDPQTDPSIWVVGLRAVDNDIVYQLEALPPGTYTLTSGFYDWYGSRSRVIRPRVEYWDLEGRHHEIQLDQFNTNNTKMISGEFTIPADIDLNAGMKLTYAYVSNEKPILSWFAIAEGAIGQLIRAAQQIQVVNVLLDGNHIRADNRNGLAFKGFGVLSANSTSALLMDYKAEHPDKYLELLKILFGGDNPIMTHVKIEMGNDRNNSTGPDPATKRTEDEAANVKRHPGFQLAADAKKINPDVKVSILRWNAPAWANTNDKIYKWYKETILAAYREYGFMVDYVNPHINEHAPDLYWTKEYANRVRSDSEGFLSEEEKRLYNRIKIVISDEVGIGTFGGAMVNDAELRAAVSAAGYHYNTDDDNQGNFKRLAEEFDVQVWNSEAQATFSNSAFRPNNNTRLPSKPGTGIGGAGSALEMANTIIKGFVNSRRTLFIYQPAIGSFYEGGQYSFKELVSARDPWSGWIHYDAGLVVLRHFSSFAKIGWENDDNTAGVWRAVPQASYTGATGTNPIDGRNGAPSYMTLAAPDKSDFSTIIVNDSEYERIYKIKAVNMGYTGHPDVEVWETRAADEGQAFNGNYMRFLGKTAANANGYYTVRVKPWSIVTVTTLNRSEDPDFPEPLPVEGERTILDTDATGTHRKTDDRILYADDFDYAGKEVVVIGPGGTIAGSESYIASRGGDKGAIPRYTHDRNGAFETYRDEETGNYVLRQQLDRDIMGLGGAWNAGEPVTAIGDFRWLNYKASVDVSFETNDTKNGANYAAIGARYQGGGNSHYLGGTPYVLKFWFDGGWQLLAHNRVVAGGNVATGAGGVKIDGFDISYDAWHNIAIQVAGNEITAYIDGVKLANYADPNPKLSGRVDLGTGYYHVRFDNLKVETVEGYAPYYSEHLDNLEMHDLAPVPNPKLIYDGPWAHDNGQGMYHYQRSLSRSQGAGATMEYTFVGTGLDILGPNDGSAKLAVTVDGKPAYLSTNTKASDELYQTFSLRGLPYGEHTVNIEVLSGTLVVDSVAVVSGEVKGLPDTTGLREAVEKAREIERSEEYRESDWQLFENALQMAEQALAVPAAYRLDQEGADQLAARLNYAKKQLITGDLRELAGPHYGAAYVGGEPLLPEQAEAKDEEGNIRMVPVEWDLTGVTFDRPYETVTVTGSYGSLETIAYVEVVPKDILYFADLNGTKDPVAPGQSSGNILGYDSPAYLAVAELAAQNGKPLLNDKPDQVYNGANGWGHGGFRADSSWEVNYKGIVQGPYSKQTTTGIYTANQVGASLTYTFDNLAPGEYTVAIGSHSWWPGNARTSDVYLEYDGKSVKVDTFTLDNASYSEIRSYNFVKELTGPFTVRLRAVGIAQSPMLSFVGLAPTAVDKTALIDLYNAHKDKVEEHYTPETWAVFHQALQHAWNVIEDENAKQADVDQALQRLAEAATGLAFVEELARTPPVFATYVNELPALPDRIRLEDGGPDYDVIAWTIDGRAPSAADFAEVFGTVAVQGAYEDGGTKTFNALVEVVPRNLKYFIDAGPTEPHIYNAVRKLTGSGLLNDMTDREYDAQSGWGYIALGSDGNRRSVIKKSAQDDLDKNGTGIMIDGGDPLSILSYRLDGLEGGKSYRFTSYHRLWWNNEMPFKIEIVYDLNGETVSHLVNRLHLDHEGHSQMVSHAIRLPEGAANVRYALTNVGSYTQGPGSGKTNRNAPLSWLAVEELAASPEPVRYASFGGIAGGNTDVWFDTSGRPIQAHGGQVIRVAHVGWNGDQPYYKPDPSADDGAWLWIGEDKTFGGRPIGGFRVYVSKDLYNWVDMGNVMVPHRVFPVEKTANQQGIQVSETQLEALKARAMGIGTNEFGQPLTPFDIEYARDFLQAYIDRSVHPDYDRNHDAGFDYMTAAYDEDSLRLAFDRTYAYYTIMERPKMLYNEQTGKYVIVYHVDGPSDANILANFDTLKNNPAAETGVSRYSRAQMGFAVSDSPFGPFKLVNAQRMNYVPGYYDQSQGMARDMTVFKDDDGKAYAIYSSEENRYTYISLLNDEYTGPASQGADGLNDTFVARVFPDQNREAPAVFKYDGYYYFITSGTTGWDPNPSVVYRANHIYGNTPDGETFAPYTRLGNPFPLDGSNTSYRSQSTAVIPYDPENGLFIYMGDRWIQRSLESSGYVWLPLRLASNGTVVEGVPISDWTLDQLEEYAPLKVLTAEETVSRLGEAPVLPDAVDVRRGSTVFRDVPVDWDEASLEAAKYKLGTVWVRGTLGGALAGKTIDYGVYVRLPDQTLYFVNPAPGPVAQYDELVGRYEALTGNALAHAVAEQEYNPASGRTWGYTGSNSALRDSTDDIFQSLRYVTRDQTDRALTYKFDLEQGRYDVYIGFYDPWYQWSAGKRIVRTIINGSEAERDRVITDAYDIAAHRSIEMAEDGTMTIVVSPQNSGNDTDVQLSWILIAQAAAEPDTAKPVITLIGDPVVELLVGDEYEDQGAIAWDDRDGDISDRIEKTITSAARGPVAAVDTGAPDTFTIRYNVSDSAGNAADEVTRTVIVKEFIEELDVTKPVITLLGDPFVSLHVGDDYEDAGATAWDDRDGEISDQIEVTITSASHGPVAAVDTGAPDTFTIRYNVSDSAGNAADEVTRIVFVVDPDAPDTNKPIITLRGDPVVELFTGDEYEDAGATAWDDRDGEITDRIEVTIVSGMHGPVTAVDTGAPDTFTIRYNVSDSAGNAADEVIRIVVVTQRPDITKPVLTLLGNPVVYVHVGDPYEDAGATAWDDRDGEITDRIEVTIVSRTRGPVAAVDTSKPDTFTIRYNVSDSTGNAADEAIRTVHVIPRPVPGPVTPPPAPAPQPEPAPEPMDDNVQRIAPEELPEPENGIIAVPVEKDKEAVVIPGHLGREIGDNALALVPDDQLRLELPAGTLNAIAGEEDGMNIHLTIRTVAEEEALQSILDAGVRIPARTEIRPAGPVFELQILLVDGEGSETAIETLDEPIIAELAIPPRADPDLLGFYRITEDGQLVYVGGWAKDGVMRVEITHPHDRYVFLEYDKTFADVEQSLWAHDVIKKVAAKHLMEGVSEEQFDPHGFMTRAQFTAMLVRLLGLESAEPHGFEDVPSDAWYAEAVYAAYAAGIIRGQSPHTFAPEDAITREEMAVMIMRAYLLATGETPDVPEAAGYRDSDQISEFALESVLQAQVLGLMQGPGNGLFDPKSNLTRAEGAQVIWNLMSALLGR